MSTTREKYTALKQRMEELKAEAKKAASEFFAEATADLFAKYPTLQSFSFAAYTPYFNDGETCYYSAQTEVLRSLVIDGTDEDEHFDGDYVESYGIDSVWDGSRRNKIPEDQLPEWRKAARDIFAVLGQFDDDFYQQSFGDHVEIIVSRNGVTTEECDHA